MLMNKRELPEVIEIIYIAVFFNISLNLVIALLRPKFYVSARNGRFWCTG